MFRFSDVKSFPFARTGLECGKGIWLAEFDKSNSLLLLKGLVMMRAFLVMCLVGAFLCPPAFAQQDRVPPVELYKTMADANKATGWVLFREYDGHQWVYFTPLVTLHCRVTEIRYSINSPALDQKFPLPECHPALPFSLPPDAGPEAIALTLDSHQAEKVAVQIVFDDGTESDVLVFEPCDGVGEATCAFMVE